jgi:PBP1b-binding outer membrane lipoprotein LpoB
MKHFLSAIAIALLLASCGGEKGPKIKYQSKIFLEKNLITFINDNPEWDKDSVTKEATDEKFKLAVVTWTKDADYIKDLKFKCTKIGDTVMADMSFKMATFELINDAKADTASILKQMKLELHGIFQTEEQSDGLALNKTYHLVGMPYKQVKRATIVYDNKTQPATYNLGTLPFTIAELHPLD